MNIDNLRIGQIIKNYKELCNLINEKPKNGCSKNSQLKEFERFVAYHNEGHKFIIDEIYKEPKPKNDKRLSYNHNIENYKIPKELDNHIGVYKIQFNNDIYIGSTSQGFRRRFLGHYLGNQKNTKTLLENGAEFSIVWDMTGIEDIELIRMVESYIINYCKINTNYNIVNERDSIGFNKFEDEKVKKRSMYINCSKYDLDIIKELLRDKGYDII